MATIEETIVPLLEETLRVAKRRVETGRVRISVGTETQTRQVQEILRHRRVEVERVPIDRVVTEPPPVREEEGGTLVIPVLEEVLVVERRLVLREEVRVRLLDAEEAVEQAVEVRTQRATVERLPPATNPGTTEPSMTMRTITGLFDTRAEAERAVEALTSRLGVSRDHVRTHAEEGTGGTQTSVTEQAHAQGSGGFLSSLRDLFLPEEDAHSYSEGVRRGGVVVSAQVEEGHVDRAMDVLEEFGAVDLDQREAEWRSQGWGGYQTYGSDAVVGASSDGSRTGMAATTTGSADRTDDLAANRVAATGTTATGGDLGTGAMRAGATTGAMARGTTAEGEESIPIVEEQLVVGKRDVGRGRVRVRSYVVETPVQEQVHLRQEHVDVERRTVDRPLTDADRADLFRERTIEATETSEEAVVSKEARVREELVLRKDVEDRTETVQDSVRRTEVEVDDERTRRGATADEIAARGPANDPKRKPGRGAA